MRRQQRESLGIEKVKKYDGRHQEVEQVLGVITTIDEERDITRPS